MKAAVLEQLNAPLTIAECGMRDAELEHGQVLVRVLVAGICGAQLQEIRGDKGDPSHIPHLLGHEGCGIVEQIGPGVKHVKKGDKVVLHWRKGNGCDVGGAIFSHEGHQGTQSNTEAAGFSEPLRPIVPSVREIKSGPLTCFSEYTIVSENRVTPVPEDFPDDLACLLGCSLSTALGVIENEARVKMGESVMIVGCGGVGLSLILAARMAHAYPVVATDMHESKLEFAESLGAVFFHSMEPWPFDGYFEVIVDTTGTAPFLNMLAPSGRYIMVGQPKASHSLPLTSHFFSGEGQQIKATQGGCFSPSTDIPRYVNLWRSGHLDGWENLITHRVSLDDINDGIELVKQGKAGRVLVEFPHTKSTKDTKSFSDVSLSEPSWPLCEMPS